MSASANTRADTNHAANLTVMADAGSSLAVAKLARDYARTQQVIVNTSFADKEAQALQITEGGAADILITSDAHWIDELQARGLIDIHSKMEFARGRMALVGPADSDVSLDLSRNFASAPLVHAMDSEPGLYIGNPEYVPQGKYAKEALRSSGSLDALEPYTLYLKHEDEIIEQLTQRHAFGIIDYGRALLLENTKVIDVFPEKSHSPMPYYAVVLAGDNMEEARKFMKYLVSGAARIVLINSGMASSPL